MRHRCFRLKSRGFPWRNLVCAAAALLGAARASAQEPSFTVGIVPQRSALELALTWTPLLHKVGVMAKCHLRFETAKNIPTFQRRVAHRAYDLVYLNPDQYIVAHQERGYDAFLADREPLRSIIVVRKGSPIRSLAALAYRSVAFPAPGALAASMLPQAYLRAHHIPISVTYVASHASVYRAVAAGFYAAGGGIMKTFRDFPKAVRDRLRILWVGPPLPPHPLAIRPGIAKAVLVRIRQAFLHLSLTQAGRALLAQIGARRFVKTSDAQYNVIRALHLDSALAGP